MTCGGEGRSWRPCSRGASAGSPGAGHPQAADVALEPSRKSARVVLAVVIGRTSRHRARGRLRSESARVQPEVGTICRPDDEPPGTVDPVRAPAVVAAGDDVAPRPPDQGLGARRIDARRGRGIEHPRHPDSPAALVRRQASSVASRCSSTCTSHSWTSGTIGTATTPA